VHWDRFSPVMSFNQCSTLVHLPVSDIVVMKEIRVGVAIHVLYI